MTDLPSVVDLETLPPARAVRLEGWLTGWSANWVVINPDPDAPPATWLLPAGDLDGDGLADALIGSAELGGAHILRGRAGGWSNLQLPDLPGSDRVFLGAGARWVASAGDLDGDGSPDTLLASATLPLVRLVFRGAGAALSGEEAAGFGKMAASAGDVNGDGLDDLLVASPAASWPAAGNTATAAWLVFGQASGLPFLNLDAAAPPPESVAVELRTTDLLVSGRRVAPAGDVNGDGFADFLVAGQEKVALVFGKGDGWAGLNLDAPGGAGVNILQSAPSLGFPGWEVSAAGDVNGDGFGDVLVGNLFERVGPSEYEGAVWVVFGKASGWGDVDLNDPGSGAVRLLGPPGSALAPAGDTNGDGYADFLVGAPEAWEPGVWGGGAAYLVLGKPSGWANANLAEVATRFVAGGYSLGAALSGVGDANGDGLSDILLGDPDYSPAGANEPRYGTAFLVFGESPSGHVTLRGTSLADSLGGGPGDDWLRGFGQDDLLLGRGGSNTIDGGQGEDRVSYAWTSADLSVDLRGGIASGWGGTDALISVERAAGGAGRDVIGGTDAPDLLDGAGEDDALFGFGGDDDLRGDWGDDTLYGGAGDDRMAGGAGNDAYLIEESGDLALERPGEGEDTAFVLAEGWTVGGWIETAYLYGAATSLTGGDYGVALVANPFVAAGSALRGGAGNDALWGQAGDDTLWGGLGNDALRGGAGADRLEGGANSDQLVGGEGADVFVFAAPGWGHDEIFDFVRGEDRLDFRGSGVASLAGFAAVLEVGGNTALFAGDGSRVDLYGVLGLAAADFLFG